MLALLFVVTGFAAHAQCALPNVDWSGFYPPAMLDRVTARSGPGLRSNFEEVMLPRLTDRERRTLAGVGLDLGQREDPKHPMNFYASTDRKVVMPLSSIKMVSDLMFAVAWLNRHRLPEKRVFDYAAMLAFRGPAPDGVRALPLAALGVPDGDGDPAVNDLFDKLFGDTMVFIMAHEMGHIFHNHQQNVSQVQSVLQENEADAFAVELMARMGAPPVGVTFYFNMVAPFECPARSTHPLSGERIKRLAATLRDNGPLFARDKPSPQRELQLIEGVATSLETVARLLDDPDVRASMRLAGQSSSVADFAGGRSAGAVPSPARQAFDGNYAGEWTDAKGSVLALRMNLQRTGQTVRGKYEFGMGAADLEGIVEGDQFDYAWNWGNDYAGRGRLKNLADGQLRGTWGYARRFEGGGLLSVRPQ
jgi:hypothetical protein